VIVSSLFVAFFFYFKTKPQHSEFKDQEVNVYESIKEGLHYIFKTKEIVGALTLDLFAVLFGGAVALIPVFAKDILQLGAVGYGFLNAASDIGAGISIFTLTFFPLRRNQGKLLLFSVFGFGACILLFGGNTVLGYIQSNAFLPNKLILCLYIIVVLLENNHSHFATAIISKNNIPFVKPALLAGIGIVIGSFIVLKYTSWGILGLVLVQGFCQVVYNNWKWPLVILKEFKLTIFQFVYIGIRETYYKLKTIFK